MEGIFEILKKKWFPLARKAISTNQNKDLLKNKCTLDGKSFN